MEEKELKRIIKMLLDDFYTRRIEKVKTLKLKDAIKRKNPYLYCAVGIQAPSDIVRELLTAYMSSSDEGIFGDAFFEPLAKMVSGGVVSPSEGIDVAIESDTVYKAIAVKSGPSVFNAQSKRKQIDDFHAVEKRVRKLKKHFDPLVGYSYGNKKQSARSNTPFRELAGQAFWNELTGDPEFYLKMIRLMEAKPHKHLPKYKKAFENAVARFTEEFTEDYCFEDGTIDWEKLTKFNSASRKRKNG